MRRSKAGPMASKRPANSLLYGDVVFLYCKTGGYVFSEVSCTTSASVIVYPVSSKDENDPNFPNLKMAAFKVLAADKVRKAQQSLADIRKTLLTDRKDLTELSTEEREALQNAEKNAEIEIHNNRVEQERVAGTLVLYGNTIQLLHLFSGKYLAINPVETSKTENINVQVELTNESSECAFFKILPRFKVKSIGHEVHLHDQVIFGVVKSTEGQYLHTSRIKYHDVGIMLYGGCREVNIASVPSGYTLKPHYHKISDDESENIIKAGNTVRLFHREMECYLVAEGSFANSKGKVMIEDVHLRKRKSDNGKLRPPSTSSITYWQIEKDRPLSGDAVAWGERCRIKHLPTRMYLAVVKDENNRPKVTLNDRDLTTLDLDTVFRLIPVIEEDDEIKYESYARINHPLTNSWLSAKQSKYTKQQFKSNATGLDALQWDTAALNEIGVTSEMNYDDAFTIEEVADDLIQKFNCVAEIIPVIKTYIEERKKGTGKQIDFQEAFVVVEALDVITDFVGSAHADLIDRQKLLRNLMVIELIVEILETHNPELSSDSHQQDVSRACYQVLEAYLKGKSGKNDIYLARFIPLFRRHIGLGLNVENMLTELMRDNEEIILGYELEDIDGVIGNLLRTKDSRFMDFLSALCVCNGRPIAEHQDYIVENLVCKYTKELFYITGVGADVPGDPNTIYFCKPEGLAQSKWQSMAMDYIAPEDHQFILAQFNLFGMLCKGNNKRAIEAIDKNLKYVTFNEALAGAKDDSLDCSLRSKYVELIIVLYVDADDKNRALLENLSYSFNYSKITENPYEEASKNPTVSLTGARNDYFPRLRDWIQDHVDSQQNVVGGKDMIGNNNFTAAVIDLLYLLVKYGYYADLNDIHKLMPPLLSLLNGENDKPSKQAREEEIQEFNETGRFKDTEENRPIFKLKVKVLKTVNLFFNFRFYLRLQRFVFDYKLLENGTQGTHLLSEEQYPLAQLAQLKSPPKDFSKSENKHLMKDAVHRLDQIFSFSEYKGAEFLPDVLLDLANYEDDEVLCESLHLLDRYHSAEDTLFERAIQTQLLITDSSQNVLKEVTHKLLPELCRLALKDVDGEQFQQLIRILRKLTSLCHLEGAVHEPHHQNQQILYNTGVFSDVMNLIFRKEYKPKGAKFYQDSAGKCQQEIISTSLQFLKLLARHHKVVQERLFGCMDRLLSLKVAIPDVAELLTEVFTGVKEICIKIEERHIEKIFKLIVKYKGCPELLELLQAVVKAEDIDLPLKQNQTVIVKYFNLNRDKFCDKFLGKHMEKEQLRESLLLCSDDSDHDLQVLLKVINLLAACCEGENLFIESLCQSIMSIRELMKILNDDKIKPDRKKPFALFLLWVFINTGKNPTLTGSIQLVHSQEMWSYLEHINILLNGIVRVMSNLPKAQATSVKLIQLRTRTTRKEVDTGVDHSKESITSYPNIPYVTDANGQLIPGVIMYIMEGVLPLIKVYYTRLFNPKKPDQSVYQKEIKVTADIASSLLHLFDVIMINEYFSSQEQWRTLCNTIIIINYQCVSLKCYNQGMIDVDVDIKAKFNAQMRDRFNGRSQNNATKQENDEEKLNRNFNNFVKNFQLAYWGPNTAQHQIHSHYDTEYSEYDDEEKGDEWLPLGSKYQEHVKCFVDRHKSETVVKSVTKRVIDYLLVSHSKFNRLTEKKQLLFRLHNIKYLQLLRTIIHNEKMHIDPKLQEDNPKKFRRQSERVREVQNQIQKFGDGSTITKLVKLLSHPDESISGEVLALLAILLYNGNKEIQTSFSSYLLKTREEKFFASMQQRLEEAANNDNKRRKLLDQLKHKEFEEQNLKKWFTEYAMQYGFNTASVVSYRRIEEGPFGDTSGRQKLLGSNDDDMGIELQEVQFQGFHSGISETYSKPQKERKQSLLSTTSKAENLPGIRITKEEIKRQKEEDRKSDKKKTTKSSKLSGLGFRDTSHVELTLRFLGLLCDGQNRDMQNYFRQQPDNIKTVNLVSETCIFLQSFYVEVTKENIDLIKEVLQTLIEMCVGNVANQQVMYNHHIVDVINRLLRTTLFRQCSLSKVLVLKSTAVKILEVMCEETSPLTKDLVGNVFKAVDIDALHTSLAYFHILSQDKDMKRNEMDDDAERAAFTTYHILIHFEDFQFEGISMEIKPKFDAPIPKERQKEINRGWTFHGKQPKSIDDDEETSSMFRVHFRVPASNELSDEKVKSNADRTKERQREIEKGWTYCEKRSKSIEVLYNADGEETLAKVHFRAINELSDEIKEKVKNNVDRSSAEDKLRDFSEWIVSVKREVQHLNYLHTHRYTRIFMKTLHWRNTLLFLWTVLMNILMIIAWDDTLPKRHLNGTEIVVPTVPREDENWFFSYVLYIGGTIHLLMSLAMVITYLLINGSNFVMPDFFYQRVLRRPRKPSYSDVPFFGLRTMYHIAFVIFSALSLPFYGYFYCVCLFHIVIDNDILQRVLKSVTKNGKQLLYVAVLGLIVIYNYAVGTFVFMPNEFDNQEEGEVVRYCNTLFECSITVLEYGLLDTIGVTVDLPRNLRDATLRAIIYDLSFFIIVTTIGLNIVFGIIVDTFSELREERNNIDQDKKGCCFICNIPSTEFERRAKGFDDHVKNEHSMWDYIRYIIYLEGIDVSDHSAIEHYVYNQINSEDTNIGYFPLFQARSLQEKKDDALTELAELKKLVFEIAAHHKEEQRSAVIQRNKEDHEEWERKYQVDEQLSHI